MTCPKCNKNLENIDVIGIYDREINSCDQYIKCSDCGYDELAEESEQALEELFI